MRAKSWPLVVLTIVLGIATLFSKSSQVPLPTFITVSPTDPVLHELNVSQQFTAQSGDTGDSFPLPGVTATQIDAGQHGCAVLSDRTVHCWPNDFYYPAVGPLPVIGLSQVTAVSDAGGGIGHTCALFVDTTVKCWGPNFYGQLGDGTTTTRDIPVTVIESNGTPLMGATAISTGTSHTCALLTNTTVKCWGDNGVFGQGRGQLGDPATFGSFSTNPVFVAGLVGAVAISAGSYHTCALLSDGRVQCWGSNVMGEIGDGTTSDRATPVFVSGLTGARAVSAEGFHFTCALLLNDTVKCWGYNDSGRLGNGTTTNSAVPVTVTGLSTAKTISVGDDHACARLGDSTVSCWGGNPYGNLGNGTTTNSSVPVQVSGLTSAVAVSAGNQLTCALLSDGTVMCWGININGQLGTGSSSPQQRTTPVATAPLGRAAWTSSDPAVAWMDAFGGMAYSVAPGVATITATYGPLSANTTLTVGDFAPTITVPADITVPATPGGGAATVPFTVTATGSPVPTTTCTVPGPTTITSPYVFPIGSTTVTCTAANSLGSDTKSFTVTVTPNALRSLSISDVTVREGDTGVTGAIFHVTLSAPSSSEVVVNFGTQNGTASGATDYTITGRTVRFTPGQTTQDVAVSVIGDTVVEPDETFLGVLSNPVNATIADGQGVATIIDDDKWLFVATPTFGPEGTIVRAESFKKCAMPVGARGWSVALTFVQRYDTAVVASVPVAPDGSWLISARIPAFAKGPAQAFLRARCFAAGGGSTQDAVYEPFGFYVSASTFTITPTSGRAGSLVTAQSVTPCPKPANAIGVWKAYVIWAGPSLRDLIGEATVRPDGSWALLLRIPMEATRDLTLEAQCGGGQYRSQPGEFEINGPTHEYGQQSFEVVPSRFTLTPTHGPAGTIVQATSIDRCPFPSNLSQPWMVSLVFVTKEGRWITLSSVPVQSDGSWMIIGRTPLLATGRESVTVLCHNGPTFQYSPFPVHEYKAEVFDTDPGEFTATPLSGPVGTLLTASSVTPCPSPNRPQVYGEVTLNLSPGGNTECFIGRAPIRPDGSVAGAIWLQLTPGNYEIRLTSTYQGGSNANRDSYRYPPRTFTV